MKRIPYYNNIESFNGYALDENQVSQVNGGKKKSRQVEVVKESLIEVISLDDLAVKEPISLDDLALIDNIIDDLESLSIDGFDQWDIPYTAAD